MIFSLDYGEKSIKLKPYSTEDERNILLYKTINDNYNLDDILSQLTNNISEDISTLTREEKIAILYKLRCLSVGDTIDIICTCSNCKKKIETEISVDDLIETPNTKMPPKYNNICLQEGYSNNYGDYVEDIDIEDLDVDEYDELCKFIDEYKVKFNFIVNARCLHCKHINNVNIDDIPFLIDNLSEEVIANFYKTTSDMVLHGNYTKSDVYNMLPFERVIHLGLLNNALAEKRKE